MAHTPKAKEIKGIKHAMQQQLSTILYRVIGPLKLKGINLESATI